MSKLRSFAVLAPCLLVVAACGDDGNSPPRHAPQSHIEILPESAATAAFGLGDTVYLTARRLTSAGAPVRNDTAVRFVWNSSDTTVVIIDADGMAEIVGFGSAEVAVRVADPVAPAMPSATDTATASVTLTGAPVVVHPGPVASMAMSYPYHAGVLLPGGQAECRGRNHLGQTGIGVASDSVSAWTAVSGGLAFSTLSTSTSHSCGMGADGHAYCWGSNGFRNLDMDLDVRSMPAPAEFGEDYQWKSVEAGGDTRTCAITTDHVPMCAGRNGFGQNGHGGEWQSPLLEWGSGHRVSMIRTNVYRTCAVSLDGAVYCAGLPISGQGGNVPVPIPSSVPLVSIEMGSYHGCGLTTDGSAHCWGWNGYGQLGTGDLIDRASVQPVATGLVFTSVHVQDESTCGVTAAGELWCWGSNRQGELGRTRLEFSAVPIRVRIGSGVKQVQIVGHAARKAACAIDAGDRVVCWGGTPDNLWGW